MSATGTNTSTSRSPEGRGFVFNASEHQAARTVRTLRQFVRELERQDVQGYLRRGDFSRWIGDVFGDRALAAQVRELEARYRATPWDTARADVIAAIRHRYDVTPSDAENATGSVADERTLASVPNSPHGPPSVASLVVTGDVT